jgi:hypothetical protein
MISPEKQNLAAIVHRSNASDAQVKPAKQKNKTTVQRHCIRTIVIPNPRKARVKNRKQA